LKTAPEPSSLALMANATLISVGSSTSTKILARAEAVGRSRRAPAPGGAAWGECEGAQFQFITRASNAARSYNATALVNSAQAIAHFCHSCNFCDFYVARLTSDLPCVCFPLIGQGRRNRLTHDL
jgi:hypothetical protein